VTIIKGLIFSQPISGKYIFVLVPNVAYKKRRASDKHLCFGLTLS